MFTRLAWQAQFSFVPCASRVQRNAAPDDGDDAPQVHTSWLAQGRKGAKTGSYVRATSREGLCCDGRPAMTAAVEDLKNRRRESSEQSLDSRSFHGAEVESLNQSWAKLRNDSVLGTNRKNAQRPANGHGWGYRSCDLTPPRPVPRTEKKTSNVQRST
jgi:hypothetical protein